MSSGRVALFGHARWLPPSISHRGIWSFAIRLGLLSTVADASRIDMADAEVVDYITPLLGRPRLARVNRVELFIHRDDEEKARKIVGEI